MDNYLSFQPVVTYGFRGFKKYFKFSKTKEFFEPNEDGHFTFIPQCQVIKFIYIYPDGDTDISTIDSVDVYIEKEDRSHRCYLTSFTGAFLEIYDNNCVFSPKGLIRIPHIDTLLSCRALREKNYMLHIKINMRDQSPRPTPSLQIYIEGYETENEFERLRLEEDIDYAISSTINKTYNIDPTSETGNCLELGTILNSDQRRNCLLLLVTPRYKRECGSGSDFSAQLRSGNRVFNIGLMENIIILM